MAEPEQVIVCHPSDAQAVRAAAIELGHATDVAIRSNPNVAKGEAYILNSRWIAGIGCMHERPLPLPFGSAAPPQEEGT